jgi:hypothetical protein
MRRYHRRYSRSKLILPSASEGHALGDCNSIDPEHVQELLSRLKEDLSTQKVLRKETNYRRIKKG